MKRLRTICKTTASGAPLALQELYKVENTHIRQISHAHSDTYNDSILLWKDVSVLPSIPFAVGVWYKQSNELIPIGVVSKPVTSPMSVSEYFKETAKVHMLLSNVLSYVLNRMATLKLHSVRFNNSEETRVARSVMWALCLSENYDKLRELEKAKEVEFCTGETSVHPKNVTMVPELEEMRAWVNSWIVNSHAALKPR